MKRQIVVRIPPNIRLSTDIPWFVNMLGMYNISTVILGVKHDDDGDGGISGTVFYNSSIAPKAKGYENCDILNSMINECHKKSIKVIAWIPQFHDQIAFKKNESWRMMAKTNDQIVPYTGSQNTEYFVSPLNPEVQDYEKSIIKEVVTNYNVDGIIIDWTRFDNFNMDLSDHSRSEFSFLHGYDPADINFDVDSPQRRRWQEWRTSKLADYIHDVHEEIDWIKPDIPMGNFILPPDFVECGQDASKFKDYIDYVSPMAYFQDWGYPLSWVYKECIKDTITKMGTKDKVIPCLPSNLTYRQYKQIYNNLSIYEYIYFTYGEWTLEKIKSISR